MIAAALVVGSAAMLACPSLRFRSIAPFARRRALAARRRSRSRRRAVPGERTLTVRFDANVARDLPWRFEPEVAKISLRTGETTTVYYKVVNLSDHETQRPGGL